MLTPASIIAIIGCGDSCRRIAPALAPRGCAVRVFDARLHAMQIESLGVDAALHWPQVLRGARLVMLDGGRPAQVVASLLLDGQLLLDLTDATPAQRESLARLAREHGGRYLAGWFAGADATTGPVLHVAGEGSGTLADALAAIGLPARDAGRNWPDAGRAPGGPALAATSSITPAIHRGALP